MCTDCAAWKKGVEDANRIAQRERERAEKAETALRRLVRDLDDLAAESNGVAGLHLNGTVAGWEWLAEDGNWLAHWPAARAALSPTPPKKETADE
jgi:hypothetical protein